MRASVYIATTLDGFIARENGELDWLPGSDRQVPVDSENEDFGFNAFMEAIDVLVMGRNTYELAISTGMWPYGNKRVIVLSNTLRNLADGVPNTVELKSELPNDLYNNLKNSGAKHLYIDGGKTIQGFLHSGLIDEIILTRVPVLIGKGIPLFGSLNSDKKLKHIETRAYKNGFVQSRYEVIN
jgi:dihydrofolate reductase